MINMIKPEYKRFVKTTKTGSKYLIAKLKKAVYGTLLAAILFYKKLKKHRESNEFEMNPYDLCTFNKMVKNREQLTIQFYVDDFLTASYKDQKVLDDLLNDLQN